MKMFKIMRVIAIAVAVMAVAPVTSFAADGRVYTEGLTTQQELEVKMQVEKLKQENRTSSPSVPVVSAETLDKASKYTEIGAAVAKGLAGAAKELGVAVNEFAQTPVGKMTMFLVVWNFFGNMFVHLAAGSAFFLVMIPIWFYMYRRYVALDSVTWTPVTPDSKRNIKTVTYKDPGGDKVAGMVIVLAAIIGAGCFITFSW